MFDPARWHRLVPLAIAAAVVIGAGSQVEAAPPPDRKMQVYEQAELIQLLWINSPTALDKKRLNTLDLDLAESADRTSSTWLRTATSSATSCTTLPAPPRTGRTTRPATRQVTVARGASVTANLTTCAAAF